MAPLAEQTAILLRRSARPYARAILLAAEQQDAGLASAGLPVSFAQPLDDIEARLMQLSGSVTVDRPELFAHTCSWYRVALHHRGVPGWYFDTTLRATTEVLDRELPAESAALVRRHLRAAEERLATAPVDLPSHLSRAAPHGELAMRFLLANLEGRGDESLAMLRSALAAGASVAELHDHVLAPAQREAGRMWLMAEIPIADEHYTSTTVDRALWLLQEHLPPPPADGPLVLTMAVGGNLHDLGMRVVAQRLQVAGLRVHHLGANMPAGDLEWAFASRAAPLVALSATMSMHLPALLETVRTLHHVTPRHLGGQRAKVLVGGEPFRIAPDLHVVLDADAGACDAVGAVAAAQRLLSR